MKHGHWWNENESECTPSNGTGKVSFLYRRQARGPEISQPFSFIGRPPEEGPGTAEFPSPVRIKVAPIIR